jgi:hypothetical protein
MKFTTYTASRFQWAKPMPNHKESHKIVIENIEYRWRATGNDGSISIGIWPTNNIGPFIQGTLDYHETWIDNGDGSKSSAGDQVIVTNRIVRRIVEHAIMTCKYDP